jgi:hypothetical protein
MTDARMVDHNDKECGLPMTSFVTLRIKILPQYTEYAISKTQNNINDILARESVFRNSAGINAVPSSSFNSFKHRTG